MDLRTIEVLIWLVKDPNLQRTAERLKLSQPTLSKRLAQLEEYIGQPLFERRGGKGLLPTSYAIELADSAKQLLDNWAYATNVAKMKGSSRPFVGLIGPSLFMQTVVAPSWAKSGLASQCVVHFRTSPIVDINFEVTSSDLDGAFLFDRSKPLDFKFMPVCVERMALIYNADCKVKPETMLAKDDDGLEWIGYRPDRDPLSLLSQSGILPKKKVCGYFEDLPSLLNVISSDARYAAVLPHQSVLQNEEKLRATPLAGTDQTLYFVYRPDSPKEKVLQVFGEYLRTTLKDHPCFGALPNPS